jgi:hypothetical protein
VHCAWAEAAGSYLVNVSRYDKLRCFDCFPFPDANEAQKANIREIAERLDAHRNAQQKQNPNLALSDIYRVLEKVQDGEPLTPEDRKISTLGDVSTLKKLHDDLDAAVLVAYGWPANSTVSDVVSRLFDLNQQRAAEEAAGKVRWLRPDFQNGSSR